MRCVWPQSPGIWTALTITLDTEVTSHFYSIIRNNTVCITASASFQVFDCFYMHLLFFCFSANRVYVSNVYLRFVWCEINNVSIINVYFLLVSGMYRVIYFYSSIRKRYFLVSFYKMFEDFHNWWQKYKLVNFIKYSQDIIT